MSKKRAVVDRYHVEPIDDDTDPRSSTFFAGATCEKKLSVLKHVSPETFAAFEMILTAVLRDVFCRIGPTPADVKSGGV